MTPEEQAELEAHAMVDNLVDAPMYAALLDLIKEAAAGNIRPQDDLKELLKAKGRENARRRRGLPPQAGGPT